jgi:predicted DNA-binding protein
MGRPPLNLIETKVRLRDDQPKRIDALVGANRMATFIREAIDRELERREKMELRTRSQARRPNVTR